MAEANYRLTLAHMLESPNPGRREEASALLERLRGLGDQADESEEVGSVAQRLKEHAQSMPKGRSQRAWLDCAVRAERLVRGLFREEPQLCSDAADESDVLVSDVKAEDLRANGFIANELMVSNGAKLSPEEEAQWPVTGAVLGAGSRIFVSMVVGPRVAPKGNRVNAIFLLDTGSPTSFLSSETLESIGLDPPPSRCQLMLHDDISLEFHLSVDSRFYELNILGMDALSALRATLIASFARTRSVQLEKQER